MIGITGYTGRLGSYLLHNYPKQYIPLSCDVTKLDEVTNCVGSYKLDGILHLAAKTDADFCEKLENQKLVSDVNLRGTFNVCRAAELSGKITVSLLSSDHVFSGTWGKYRENSKTAPVNFYGKSKLAAESLQAVFSNLKIIRTSYLFDPIRLSKHVEKLLNGEPQIFPTFIHRSFTYIYHFAELLETYFSDLDEMPKILHLSSHDTVSWYGFMQKICKEHGRNPKLIVPRKTELTRHAPRPLAGGLNTSLANKLGFNKYSYEDGIVQMLLDYPIT